MKNIVGVDIGGTFTDCVIIDEAGNYSIGKSLSTPFNLSNGMLQSIDVAKERAEVSSNGFYQNIQLVCHGSTTATNALLEGQGAKVGLLITKGFEDTLAIGRILARTVGLRESQLMEFQKADTSLTGNFQTDILPFILQFLVTLECQFQNAGVVTATQSPVGGQHEQYRVLFGFVFFQQGMVEFQICLGQIGDKLGNLAGIGSSFRSTVHGFLESRGGDQFHGPCDLTDVFNCL